MFFSLEHASGAGTFCMLLNVHAFQLPANGLDVMCMTGDSTLHVSAS